MKDKGIDDKIGKYSLVEDYFDKRDKLYYSIQRVVDTIEEAGIDYFARIDHIKCVVYTNNNKDICVQWEEHDPYEDWVNQEELEIPKEFIDNFDRQKVIDHYRKEVEKLSKHEERVLVEKFVSSMNNIKGIIALEDIIEIYQARDMQYGNERDKILNKILERK